ncbi:MAG TPA: hypothetical protein VFP55_01120, partial [Solirubrobacteraceae bacterium]|nr:hypothetical protein [Solirubrobacteraceae bacterium]
RGMLRGMPTFVAFCAVVGLLIVPAGTLVAFSLALATAVGLQLLALNRRLLPAAAGARAAP